MKTQIFDTHLRLLMSMLKIPCDILLKKFLDTFKIINAAAREFYASNRVLFGSFVYVDYASELISNAMFVAKRLCFAFKEKSFQIIAVCSAHPLFSSLYRKVDIIIKTSCSI